MADSTQEQEPPLWLAAATRTKPLTSLPKDFPVIDLTPKEVHDGPLDPAQDVEMGQAIDSEDGKHYESLEAKLGRFTFQRGTSTLHIKGDAPTAAQFSLISSTFPNVKQLYLQTGVFEGWNNAGFPSSSTWPLELLVISDACGEYVTAEPIINGEVEHLVFYLTHNLTFEGCPIGTEDPDDISQWTTNAVTGLPFYETPMSTRSPEGSKLRNLEILENDAIETFARFMVAHFETVGSVEALTIRSLYGTDMIYMPDGILGAVLPHLESLRHLELSLRHHIYFSRCELGDGEGSEPSLAARDGSPSRQWLIEGLPPNLETFYFRGPMAIAIENGGRWLTEWAAALSNTEYLPRLTKVGFWLDQPESLRFDEEEVAPEFLDAVQDARTKVREILVPVLSARGVELVDWDEDGTWRDPWFDECWPDNAMDNEE